MKCPDHMGSFEFVVLASLRSAQLARGCTPKFPSLHKHTVTAQGEVLNGQVARQAPDQARVETSDAGGDDPAHAAAR